MNKLIMGMLALVLMSGCSVVGPQDRAVKLFMGNPTSEVGSGATLWIPFVYGLTKFDMSVQKQVIETTASSKDLQPLDSHIAVNWRIEAADLTKFYRDIGTELDAQEKVISPAVNEVFKAATSKLTAEEVVSRRAELKNEIDASLESRLKPYGLKIIDVSVVNIKFSDQFLDAIEKKQVAEQRTKQAQYEAATAKVNAEASVNQARGQAESQKLLQTSLTPQMLQKLYLDKWSGVLPVVMTGTGATMFNIPLPSHAEKSISNQQ